MSSTSIIKSLALLALGTLFLQAAAAAHEETATLRSITVTGQGEAKGVPDQARINAGVQTHATTVDEATQQNQAAVAQIMRALKKHGVEKKNIQTANYSIWPEQRQDPRRNGELTITGYRVNNTVNVTIDDIDKVGKILGAVADAGANTIHGVNFVVKDPASLEAQARKAAMANAHTRAESLARMAGVELGEVQSISMTSGGGHPIAMRGNARMAMAEAASAPGISPGELSVNVQVHVVYAIR